MTTVAGRYDWQARAMGGGYLVGGGTTADAETGTATSTTSTSLTNSGAAFPTLGSGPMAGYTGQIVVAHSNGSYGVILTNSATVLTVDMWHAAVAPQTVASTPSGTTGYTIVPGQAPAYWMGLSSNSTAPASDHTFLDNGSAAISELFGTAFTGLSRQACTFAHTASANTFTLTKQFTVISADSPPKTIEKIGIFAHGMAVTPTTSNSGTMLYETALTSPPVLALNDQITCTDTITM